MPLRTHCHLFVLMPLAACGTLREWQEMQTAPMLQAEVYNAIDQIAGQGGLVPSAADCDRGLGIWQSRWRHTQTDRGVPHPARYRLRAEVLLDHGSPESGWTVRYYVEQQWVKDLKQSTDPQESDWSDHGQNREAEFLFGDRLRRRLSPPRAAAPRQ
jgi:hypothetical protein